MMEETQEKDYRVAKKIGQGLLFLPTRFWDGVVVARRIPGGHHLSDQAPDLMWDAVNEFKAPTFKKLRVWLILE
jgi:hypothetical protein